MKPLHGWRIVVTRPASARDPLAAGLEALGARVLRAPSIEIADVEGDDATDALLRDLPYCDWVVFTSVSGVEAGLRRLDRLGVPRAAFASVRVAAVGPATAGSLAAAGIDAAVPAQHRSAAIAGITGPPAGRRFLLIRGDLASEELPTALRAGGGLVDEAIVYRTVPVAWPAAGLGPDDFDVVTFTSPSTVHGFVASLDERSVDLLADADVVTIGPVTTEAAREAGLAVAAEADPHTIDGLIAAVLALAEASR